VNIVSVALDARGLDVARRAGLGDAEAFEALYREHEGAVFALASRLCGPGAEAEDVLQETFLEAAKSLARYRGEGPLAGWLKRICASKALMRMRSARRFGDGARDEAGAPLPLDARLDLEPALARLPSAARAVVWLHDVEGYTHTEIASLMGLSESYSKSQLSRAHSKLRDWLKPSEGGVP
jgi:RNA polymerase sigma factor (sigma-70 family)